MKRHGNLFDEICSIENLRKAHKNARKGKGWYKEVIKIDQNPDFYLTEIQSMLADHAFHTSEYTVFYKFQGGKAHGFNRGRMSRKGTCRKMQYRMKAVQKHCESGREMNFHELCSVNSYLGWLKHCDSFRLRRKYFDSLYMKG